MADRHQVSTLIDFRLPDEEAQTGITFFSVHADLVTRIVEFWPESYDPPASRADLVERY